MNNFDEPVNTHIYMACRKRNASSNSPIEEERMEILSNFSSVEDDDQDNVFDDTTMLA